jgi:hypothetical protein
MRRDHDWRRTVTALLIEEGHEKDVAAEIARTLDGLATQIDRLAVPDGIRVEHRLAVVASHAADVVALTAARFMPPEEQP